MNKNTARSPRNSVRRVRKQKPRFLAVDFFCGAGGTTRGLIDAGGYVIAGIDKDLRCRKTYTKNNKNPLVDGRRPRFLDYDLFPKRRDYPDGEQRALFDELDALISKYRSRAKGAPLLFAICAPCQPFTKVARKKLTKARKQGRERDRNLLTEATKFVAKYKPELILSENVSGIRDEKFGGVWDSFRRRLARLGYTTGTNTVCTSRFGIAQYRKRSILVAIRSDFAKIERNKRKKSAELVVPDSNPRAPEMVTVKQAIGHLPAIRAGKQHATIPNHKARTLSKVNLRRISSAMPGESNAYMGETRYGDLSLICHRKVNRRLKDRCFSDVYTRMHPDRPSPTITTKCHSISNGRFGHYDRRQKRGISLREAAKLQSFRSNYVFYPKNQIEPIARMIGNAVPPKLAAFFADYLVSSARRRRRAA